MRLFSVFSVAILGVLAMLRATAALPGETTYQNKNAMQPDPSAYQMQPPTKPSEYEIQSQPIYTTQSVPEVTLAKPDPYDTLPTKAYSAATTDSSKSAPQPPYPTQSYRYTNPSYSPYPFSQLPFTPGFLYKGDNLYKQDENYEHDEHYDNDDGHDVDDDDDSGSYVSYCAKNSFYPSLAQKFAFFKGL